MLAFLSFTFFSVANKQANHTIQTRRDFLEQRFATFLAGESLKQRNIYWKPLSQVAYVLTVNQTKFELTPVKPINDFYKKVLCEYKLEEENSFKSRSEKIKFRGKFQNVHNLYLKNTCICFLMVLTLLQLFNFILCQTGNHCIKVSTTILNIPIWQFKKPDNKTHNKQNNTYK